MTATPRTAFVLTTLLGLVACSSAPSTGTTSAASPGADPGSSDTTDAGVGTDAGTPSGGGGTTGPIDPKSCGATKKPATDAMGKAIAGVTECAGIVYDPVVNLPEVSLDMYVPPSFAPGKKYPAIIYLHGGGWKAGEKEDVNSHQFDYLKRGYFVFSLNYRLSADGQTKNPVDMTSGAPPSNATDIQDVKTAIQFIRAAGASFVDSSNLIGWGFSAGAHLAVLAGVSANDEDAHPEVKGRSPGGESTALKAVVAQSAIFDFDPFVANPMPSCGTLSQNPSACGTVGAAIPGKCTTDPQCNSPATCEFGDEYATVSRTAAQAMLGTSITTPPSGVTASVTPLTYVDAGDPPIYALAGTCDGTVPPIGGKNFAPAANAIGADVTFTLVEGAGHQETLDHSINPTGDADVANWLMSKGLPQNAL